MIAAQDTGISAAAATIYQLSEDERIRQECEAREDYLKRERGMEKIIEKQKKEIDDQKKEIERLKALLAAKDQ